MSQRLWKSIKSKTAVLLSGTLLMLSVLPVPAYAAAGASGTKGGSKNGTVKQSVYSNVYAPQIPALPKAKSAALTWNLLAKAERSVTPTISVPDYSKVRLTPDGKYAGFIRMLLVSTAPAEVRMVVTVHDRLTGTLENIVGPTKTGRIVDFDFSGDARFVAFSYQEGVSDGESKVYLYDRETKRMETISPNASEAGEEESTDQVTISEDGRYVAFDSKAKGLVPEDNDDNRDVFVYDRTTGKLTRISTRPGLDPDEAYDSAAPSISGDGRYIAFESQGKLVDEDTNYENDIYVYDRQGGSKPFQRVSVGMNGDEAQGESLQPSISGDGKVVAFASNAVNLVPGDTNFAQDIFVYDGRSGSATIKRVSLSEDGQPHQEDSQHPYLSPDGRYVGYDVLNDDPEIGDEAYVAEVETLASAKVKVPKSPFRPISPSTKPAVGSGATPVAYYSWSTESFGELGDIVIPDWFVASRGSAPAWPTGSALQVTDIGPDHVTLQWPNAEDAKGVVGYRLYMDGAWLAYVPAGGGNRFTAKELLPGVEHLFQVEAVNGEYNATFGGPTYKFTASNGGSQFAISWYAQWSRNGIPVSGSDLNIQVKGASGRQAKAEVAYKAWNGTEAEPRTATLTMQESSAASGNYGTVFPIAEGITELSSLTVKMVDNATGVETVKTAENWPVIVSGTVELDIVNPWNADLAGSILTLTNKRFGTETTIVQGTGPYMLSGLYPGEDYLLTLHSPNHRYLWAELNGVRAEAGRKVPIQVPITQPANMRVQVVDPSNKPVPNVPVQLWDSSEQLLAKLLTDANGWTSWQEGLDAGGTVQIRVDVEDRLFEQVPKDDFKLSPGDNEKVMKLVGPPEGILEGTVTDPDGKPVVNALITATQSFGATPVVRQVRSSLEGAYKLSLLEGEASIEAAETSYHYSTEGSLKTHITRNSTTALPIPLRQPGTGIINLKVYTKEINGDWTGPLNLEQMNFLTQVETRFGRMHGYYQNAYYVQGTSGDSVNVCVTATVPSYMSKCEQVILDSGGNATAEIRLEEKGARVQGVLEGTDYRAVSGTIFELLPNGNKVWTRKATNEDFAGGSFHLNVPKAGSFRLELSRQLQSDTSKYEYASVDFTVAENQVLKLGTISFSQSKYFANQTGNSFTAVTNRAAPGETVSLRVAYKNGRHNPAAENASLLLEIPEAMTPVLDREGRVVVTGGKEEAVVNGNMIRVPLGSLAPGQAGTVTYSLKVSPTYNSSSVSTSARIQAQISGKPVEELLGTVLLDSPKVTVEVPARLFNPTTRVGGFAPAGSEVKVYDGEVLLGSAAAAPTGYWSLEVTLPHLGDPAMHALRAETEANSVKLQSETAYTEFSVRQPRLLEVGMAQAPNGKWMTFNSEQGVMRPPYTVVPGNPFQFELKFDKPHEVNDVYVYLGGQNGEQVLAVLDKDKGIYRAVTPTEHGALGGVYVSYNVKPEPFVYDGKVPTMEEIRQSMPEGMKDFEVESVTPFQLKEGQYSGTAVIKLPSMEGLKLTVTLTIEPNVSYRPSEQELQLAEGDGVPIYNSSSDYSEDEEKFTSVTEGYMPMNVLFPNGLPAELSDLAARKPQLSLQAAASGSEGSMARVKSEVKLEFKNSYTNAMKLNGTYRQFHSFSERINRISYGVQTGMDCWAEIPKTAKQAGKALLVTVGGEVAKTALKGWTGAMSLTGAGGIAAGAATFALSMKIDRYVDKQVDAVGSGYNMCYDDSDRYDRYGRKIANPKWIYDPSGFVYEAVESNRLSEVEATVLYLDTTDPTGNRWVVWDAAEYEQVNPQRTDEAGKYGWDVPPGKWKVVWEKAGYEMETSGELEVPPPHTEVNAGLVSRAAPEVQSVTGVTYEGGSYVDVVLTKYVKVTELSSDAVSITDPNGKTIAGTVRFDKPVASDGKSSEPALSRTIRFETETKLPIGAGYRVKVSPTYFKSYADVWMTGGYESGFAVTAPDKNGPEPVEARPEGEGRMVRLLFNEPLARDRSLDATKFALNGDSGAIASAVQDIRDERALLLTLGRKLPPGKTQLQLLSGATTDPEGNASREKTLSVSFQAASGNAALSQLTIDAGPLTPGFDPEHTSYTVKVPAAAEHLQVTATTADAKAKLSIEGMDAVSGTPRTVRIPASGEIAVTVTAEDSTLRTYTISVVRQGDGPLSDDAALSALTVSPGELTPTFKSSATDYEVSVASGVTELQIAATSHPKAAIAINGAAAASGAPTKVAIPADGKIRIVVTAEDRTTTKTYTISVVRKPNNRGRSGSSGAVVVPPPPANPSDSVDLSKDARIDKQTKPNGQTALRITPNAQYVENALKEGKAKRFVMEAKERADEYVLVLPSSLMKQMGEAQAAVQLSASFGKLLLPADSIAITESLQSADIAIRWSQAAPDEEGELREAARRQSEALKWTGGAATIAVEAVTGSRTTELSLSEQKPMEVELSIGNETQRPGLYRYDQASGRWSFIAAPVSGTGIIRFRLAYDAMAIVAPMEYINGFHDIEGHWGRKEIEWMAQRLLVDGYSATEFRPDQSVTRAEFTAMLVRSLGLRAPANNVSFADVSTGDWYFGAVQAGTAAGIVEGIGEQRFAPNEVVTREQMTVMIARAYRELTSEPERLLSASDSQRLDAFEDKDRLHDWSRSEVAMAVQEGLVEGVSATRFDPAGLATRAQAAAVLSRLLNK